MMAQVNAAPQVTTDSTLDSHKLQFNGLSNGLSIPRPTTNGPVSIPQNADGVGAGPAVPGSSDRLEVTCGPLLNYKGMSEGADGGSEWHGSILVVARPSQFDPVLTLACEGPVAGAATNGVNGETSSSSRTFTGVKLYADPVKTFWRFQFSLPLQGYGARWQYTLPQMEVVDGTRAVPGKTRRFCVPAARESMRIMFHSCNGFSVGTDPKAWPGPDLWNDVNRVHGDSPFHVMIGGGDQIYNDGIRATGPLKRWTDIASPRKRREFPFDEKLRDECDQYYFDNYIAWYSKEPFATANAQIPQVNIWDDHDIIDGFGSYTDHFMHSHVFRGIGGVAHKYYMLFQHHFPPPVSTFTSEAPQTTESQGLSGTGADPSQLGDTYVMQEKHEDPSWIIGSHPGPYVAERSRSLYMQLGHRIGFVGIDARTERTRHQINYPETYEIVFNRVNEELSRKSGQIKHLVVLLGVPIAYPRLIWLENILTSPIIGPIRFLNKRFGVAGGLFNNFDGQVDLLDDLDDHYTAHQHKKERRELMHGLQALAKKHSVRVTILGGDVHLAAFGRFYSHPKLGIPTEQDHRYMGNIISSAITNKPPPKAVANMLSSRNKIHHLDHETDETLLNLFDKQPGNVPKAANKNHCTMPSRNYAILTETGPGNSAAAATNGTTPNGKYGKDCHNALNDAEDGAGVSHPAAAGVETSTCAGPHGLDICYKVEINPLDREGKTQGYGLSIPALTIDTTQENLTDGH